MYQSWVDATIIGKDVEQDPWAADFSAHPLLDPDFQRKGGRLLQLMRNNFRRIIRDDDAYRRELGRFYHPGLVDEAELPPLEEMAEGAAGYLDEADVYLAATIRLLPASCRPAVPCACDWCSGWSNLGQALPGEHRAASRVSARRGWRDAPGAVAAGPAGAGRPSRANGTRSAYRRGRRNRCSLP